ncbi:PaaX family transcriptional regulator C-terminal domain-containing protein [Acidiphilium acidophilum]|uniref:PaaX family transcriptional regulator C-terminal domain-containing protein n=1 Tax=Acidiphilium acidophilum TaxID=76588 RepID=UPI002E8E6D26|nr:PaaX family transcriptional regulator C-terminal domain-containing protein [Acidiphilium acidophilum]
MRHERHNRLPAGAPLVNRRGLGCYRGMNAHVATLVARLQEQPSHTGSLVLTLMGDAIMPRGGSVALSTILDLCAGLDIGPGVVRTAVSRLAADGWLVAERQSRASFYAIGPDRRGEYVRAARHIFGPARHPQVDRMTLILLDPGDSRESVRHRLTRLGFVAWQNVMIAPERPLPPSVAASVLAVTAQANAATLPRLAARAWRLESLAGHYGGFIETFGPIARAAPELEPRDAILTRILLIHDYRRIMLRDPRLPTAFLPPGWIGDGARHLCATLYAALRPASELWLDREAITRAGGLPPPDSSLAHRFADVAL